MKYPLVATRDGVFAYMQMLMEKEDSYRKLSSYIRKDFVLLRTHGEELARFHFIKDGVTEVTAEQIYDALAMTGEMTKEEVHRLMALEELACSELWAEKWKSDWPEGLSWLRGLEGDFSAQLLAGASRRAVAENDLAGAASFGALFGGPILMPYVQWLLNRSEAMGFKRLYFIARDGYILKGMADALIERLGLKIETHYIHGSRRAWRMPSYRGIEGELRGLVGWSHTQHIRNAEELAEVLDMPADKLRPYLVPEYFDEGHWLSYEGLNACVAALDRSKEFRQLLQRILTEKRKLVVDYLRQEIDTSDDDFAFVELGGGGFTQICLSRLIQDFYQGGVRTFFYKMDRVRRPSPECTFYNFFPSKLKNDLVVEMVCRAPEGQTEGYVREGERVVPVKKQGEREAYLAHGYGEYVQGVKAFTEAYVEAYAKLRGEPSLRASLACMNALAEQENNEVMEFFGGMPNRVTGREEGAPDFAPSLTKRQVQDMFVRYADGVTGAHYQGTDFEMSLKRSMPKVRAIAEKYMQRGGEIRNRWLKMFPMAAEAGFVNTGGLSVRPYSMLGKRVVLYGAGKRGQRWYTELSADKAIEVVQWLDKGYLRLKDELPVSGDMDSLGQVSFDWLLVDFADPEVLQSVIEELQGHGVALEKIYTRQRISDWMSDWISKWMNYLHV
ncbi:MAG: hypothetical protein IJU00_00405 [Selenomonas sp.]|nr:hypothetical protein [Selenomonas sp.]